MYKEVKFTDISNELLQQLIRGAFLTVKDGDRINTMTIGWGSLGYAWNKPILMVMVRKSRYTYDMIENTDEFTVSLPLKGQLRNELNICGTKSGRDMDKFSDLNIKSEKGQAVGTPIISDCDLHIECKIVYKHDMDKDNLDEGIIKRAYAEEDYHTLYYGEILKAYILE